MEIEMLLVPDKVFQARNGFNCLGFIPVAVLNQRGKGDGLR